MLGKTVMGSVLLICVCFLYSGCSGVFRNPFDPAQRPQRPSDAAIDLKAEERPKKEKVTTITVYHQQNPKFFSHSVLPARFSKEKATSESMSGNLEAIGVCPQGTDLYLTVTASNPGGLQSLRVSVGGVRDPREFHDFLKKTPTASDKLPTSLEIGGVLGGNEGLQVNVSSSVYITAIATDFNNRETKMIVRYDPIVQEMRPDTHQPYCPPDLKYQ